jgi:hypothetical protein
MSDSTWEYQTADGKTKPIRKWHFVLYTVWNEAAVRIAPDDKEYISTSVIASSLQPKFPSMTTSRVWQILKICQINGFVECKKASKKYCVDSFGKERIIKLRGRPKLFWRLTDRGENYWRYKTNLFKKISEILYPKDEKLYP